VFSRPVVRLCAWILPALLAAPLFAARWRCQYFYDDEKTSMILVDLQFSSPARGLAVGYIVKGTSTKPTGLITSDGGAHWQPVPLPARPVSLFFLNESLGWLVAEKGGLYRTTEAGRNWTKVSKMPVDALRVHFFDEKRGVLGGPKKGAFITGDGGQKWTPIAEAAKLPGDPKYSTFNWISFANSKVGLLSGFNQPPRFGRNGLPLMVDVPIWVDPEAFDVRDTPHLIYTVETADGGATWKAQSASVLGIFTRVRLLAEGWGFGLMTYSPQFTVPAEVYRVDLTRAGNTSAYKNKNLTVTDVWPGSSESYIAGILGNIRMRSFYPGKVQVLNSRDGKNWAKMDVDYRATGTKVFFAGSQNSLWMATDTGVILKLED
jgi:photosystem II stability/assembly factor-like uncharacterized protein